MQRILAKPLNPLRNICIFYCSSITSVTIRSTIMLKNIINLHVIFVPSQDHKNSLALLLIFCLLSSIYYVFNLLVYWCVCLFISQSWVVYHLSSLWKITDNDAGRYRRVDTCIRGGTRGWEWKCGTTEEVWLLISSPTIRSCFFSLTRSAAISYFLAYLSHLCV